MYNTVGNLKKGTGKQDFLSSGAMFLYPADFEETNRPLVYIDIADFLHELRFQPDALAVTRCLSLCQNLLTLFVGFRGYIFPRDRH